MPTGAKNFYRRKFLRTESKINHAATMHAGVTTPLHRDWRNSTGPVISTAILSISTIARYACTFRTIPHTGIGTS